MQDLSNQDASLYRLVLETIIAALVLGLAAGFVLQSKTVAIVVGISMGVIAVPGVAVLWRSRRRGEC